MKHRICLSVVLVLKIRTSRAVRGQKICILFTHGNSGAVITQTKTCCYAQLVNVLAKQNNANRQVINNSSYASAIDIKTGVCHPAN